MADLTILREAAAAYCASMTVPEWEAFAASVREPSEIREPSPDAKKERAARMLRNGMRQGMGV
ncbi:hypothetical protein [Nocardia cyriacigeorgica]|uniref:hypothetical protein n=1 Tax=Nocardia cyriacigeorgica TaxID=135487 RepID=UPI0002FD100F|nr:hypothetical protein [Nocardia cyriacigeorgica]BDT84604.1 hypothetical protein FMUAM8_03680 [Nocardia cyriacigeorgica]